MGGTYNYANNNRVNGHYTVTYFGSIEPRKAHHCQHIFFAHLLDCTPSIFFVIIITTSIFFTSTILIIVIIDLMFLFTSTFGFNTFKCYNSTGVFLWNYSSTTTYYSCVRILFSYCKINNNDILQLYIELRIICRSNHIDQHA